MHAYSGYMYEIVIISHYLIVLTSKRMPHSALVQLDPIGPAFAVQVVPTQMQVARLYWYIPKSSYFLRPAASMIENGPTVVQINELYGAEEGVGVCTRSVAHTNLSVEAPVAKGSNQQYILPLFVSSRVERAYLGGHRGVHHPAFTQTKNNTTVTKNDASANHSRRGWTAGKRVCAWVPITVENTTARPKVAGVAMPILGVMHVVATKHGTWQSDTYMNCWSLFLHLYILVLFVNTHSTVRLLFD